MQTGYSGTPLAKKLGLKTGMTAYIHGAPQAYTAFFSDFPEHITFSNQSRAAHIDFIHVFETKLENLENTVSRLKPLMIKTGMMWVSWPKGNSKINTNIKRESLRTLVLGLGLVDIKVCAVDENWSGLKFVYRLKDR